MSTDPRKPVRRTVTIAYNRQRAKQYRAAQPAWEAMTPEQQRIASAKFWMALDAATASRTT